MSFTQLEGARGVRMDGGTNEYIPAHIKLRPLHDRIIVQVLDVTYSRLIHVIHRTQPIRGLVLAAGPGCYPIRYIWKSDDKTGKRRKVATIHSGTRRPIQVKVGDIVELGGEHDMADGTRRRGYTWETFYWGDKLCAWATERDVCAPTGHICPHCGHEERAELPEPLATGPASQRAGVSGRHLSSVPAGGELRVRA